MSYSRADRVGDLIRKEIADILLHGDVRDPRVGFVTITTVKMSKDLKHAKVYFSIIGSREEMEESLKGLMSASGYIRRRLAKTLDLKAIPSIRFIFDDSIEYSSHISDVIKEING